MSLGLKPHTTRKPNRHTITQLIDAARKDTDFVSVFANGVDRADSDEFIFIAKQPVAAHIERMLRSQRLITDKDVEGGATVDVDNPATCVGCGCTDRHACAAPCSWLAVNRSPDDLTGVCSTARSTSTPGAMRAGKRPASRCHRWTTTSQRSLVVVPATQQLCRELLDSHIPYPYALSFGMVLPYRSAHAHIATTLGLDENAKSHQICSAIAKLQERLGGAA